MPTPKDHIRAVYNDDLLALLERLGVVGDFNNGRLKCFHCGTALTAENLYAVFPDSGQVKGVCSSAPCILALVERTTQR